MSIINKLEEWFKTGFLNENVNLLVEKKDYHKNIQDLLKLVGNPTNFCKEEYL